MPRMSEIWDLHQEEELHATVRRKDKMKKAKLSWKTYTRDLEQSLTYACWIWTISTVARIKTTHKKARDEATGKE